MDEKVRQRALRRLLRITLPDGKVLCYKSATMTFVEALQKIEADKLKEVKLESYHLPLISQEVYPRFKDWMEKPLQGDTSLMSHFEGVIEGVIEGVGKDIKEKLASILCVLNDQPGLRTTMLSSKTESYEKSSEKAKFFELFRDKITSPRKKLRIILYLCRRITQTTNNYEYQKATKRTVCPDGYGVCVRG